MEAWWCLQGCRWDGQTDSAAYISQNALLLSAASHCGKHAGRLWRHLPSFLLGFNVTECSYIWQLYYIRCSIIPCSDWRTILSIAVLGSAWLAISLRMLTPMSLMRSLLSNHLFVSSVDLLCNPEPCMFLHQDGCRKVLFPHIVGILLPWEFPAAKVCPRCSIICRVLTGFSDGWFGGFDQHPGFWRRIWFLR